MDDTHYAAANWGFTWDEAINDQNSIQGSANLVDNSLLLDLPFGRLLGDPGVFVVGREAKPTETDYLFGFSQDGYYLALKDAYSLGTTTHIPGGDNQKIGGAFLLVSRSEFNPESKVSEIQLRATGLREWFASSPVGMQIDSITGKVRAITYDLDNEESYNRVILDDDAKRIEISHHTTTEGLTCAGSSMNHDCVLSVSLKNHLSFQEAVDLINDIARFLSFCLGFMAEIKDLKLRFAECESLASCHGPFLRGLPPKSQDLTVIPFKYSSLENAVEEYLKAWLRADTDLRSAKDMIVSLMTYRWDMPIDLHFVAASQALEALTRVNNDSLSLPEDEYDSYVKIIKESVTDKAALKWISERMPKNLKGQTRRLREFCDKYLTYVNWIIGDRKAFVDNHTWLRNGYTHRDAQSIKADDRHYEKLYWHTECLLMLSYGVIWIILGMDANHLISQLEKTGFYNYKIHKIKKLYEA